MNWVKEIAPLANLSSQDMALLNAHCETVTLPAGQTIFSPQTTARQFIILVEGSVLVRQTGQHGRDIILYRLSGGETCILTTSCLLSGEVYNAEAITETEVRALLLPEAAFNNLLAASIEFRRFVFSSYASRIASLIHLIEEVTFEKIETRLSHKLLQLSENSATIHATHQTLATELGSAREVIGRHLKEFDRKGWISLSRGCIEIVDREALRHSAAD
ncbi:Crp/Fnr family transcriptional regulator [Sneathiella sp.]|jgi:CRP/FNR family transcriptional regulator|uniref:Crp/Fnr family transcriptional regulator n=1 Tax=Sneathiella sp. TaxID=1964365 RepID=UPI0039E31051